MIWSCEPLLNKVAQWVINDELSLLNVHCTLGTTVVLSSSTFLSAPRYNDKTEKLAQFFIARTWMEWSLIICNQSTVYNLATGWIFWIRFPIKRLQLIAASFAISSFENGKRWAYQFSDLFYPGKFAQELSCWLSMRAHNGASGKPIEMTQDKYSNTRKPLYPIHSLFPPLKRRFKRKRNN